MILNEQTENIDILVVNSTESLSLRFADSLNVFVLPPICLAGMTLNLVCVLVVATQRKQRLTSGALYSFVIATRSLADLVFLCINSFTCVIRCGSLCPHAYTFAAKVWELYVHLFVGNTLLLFATSLDLCLAFQRLVSFDSSSRQVDFRLTCAIVLVVSVLLNVPSYLLTRHVHVFAYLNKEQQTPLYQIGPNSMGKNDLVVGFLFALTLLRGLVPLVVLFLTNLSIAYKFRMYSKRKRKINPTSQSKKSFFLFILKNY